MHSKCRYCGDPLVGRADKSFCTDQCRSAYHYNRYKTENKAIRLIDKILKKNRRILLRMINSGRKKVGARELYLEGFNFDFTTHSIKDPVNKSRKFCYEVGYLEHLDGTVSIVVEEFGALSRVKR